MSTSMSKGGSGGITFVGLLTIVFIVLKLLNKINWSWIWVLSPIWIGIVISIGMFLIPLLIILLFGRK